VVTGRADIVIGRSADAVFEFVVRDFFRNYPRWSPEVTHLEVLTPGPIQVGSRARQRRLDHGRRSESTFHVVALQPPTLVEFAEGTDLFRAAYRIEPLSERARLTFTFELTRLEFFARPFESVIRSTVQNGTEQVVRRIKALVEQAPVAPEA
jgi:hypothetical protein